MVALHGREATADARTGGARAAQVKRLLWQVVYPRGHTFFVSSVGALSARAGVSVGRGRLRVALAQ